MAFQVLVGIVSSPGEEDGGIALIADSISSLVTGGMSVGFKVESWGGSAMFGGKKCSRRRVAFSEKVVALGILSRQYPPCQLDSA